MKRIIPYISVIIIVFCVAVMLSVCSGCTTQASIMKDEPYACFSSRYLAREKQNSDKMTEECANTLRREWCVKMLTDEKTKHMFKDFNDCWRQ